MAERRAFTVASLAQEWECSEGVIRKLIREGRLACFRVASLIRIPAVEVQRFECQNIASNDSEADTLSSIETPRANDTGSGYTRPTGLALRRKLGKDGGSGATIHLGPWGES